MFKQKFIYVTSITHRSCRQKQFNNITTMDYASESKNIEDEKEKELQKIAKTASIDDPPVSCCLSGCANCVYIAWAEALTNKMEDASPEIVKKIMDSVDDPSMKAYLEMELRIRNLKK